MYSSTKSKGILQLTDLPETLIVQIAEQLPVIDLPSLVCSCRTLAAMAPVIYSERKVLDMSCFELITFRLCLQLIDRFSHAQLVKCRFWYSVISEHQAPHYDEEIVLVILERFLDNFYPRNCKLLADLYSALESEESVGFRPIDILAHCYLLDKLLNSQECLKELDLDVEFSVLKVPGRHQPLMRPFIALDVIQKACPQLELYRPDEIRYHAIEVNYQHLQVRFLNSCKNLKMIGVMFLLNTYQLELFDQLVDPLALERAWFYLQQWQVSKEKRLQNCQRLQKLASKMISLKSVDILFKSRGSLSCFKDFVRNLPCVESLQFIRSNFASGFSVHNIDEGVHNSHLFSDAFSNLPPTIRKLCLRAVPQEDFDVLFQRNGPLPQWIKALTVHFDWNDNQLSEEQEKILTKFLADSHHLEGYYIEGHTVLNDTRFAVSSGIKSRNSKQCLTSLDEDFFRGLDTTFDF